MNSADWRGLVIMTLAQPAEAGRRLLELCPKRDVLWLVFFLTVVLNTIVQTTASLIIPAVNPDLDVPFEPVAQALATSTGILFLSIAAFFFAGRLIGGQASFNGIMCLVLWLQLLQIAARVVIYASTLIAPPLFSLLFLAMSLYSLYITLHFINQAHQFHSLGKSFIVVLLSALAAVPFVLILYPLP